MKCYVEPIIKQDLFIIESLVDLIEQPTSNITRLCYAAHLHLNVTS